MNINKEFQFLKSELKKNTNFKRAEGAKKYLKSPFRFYGVDTPTKRNIVKEWFKKHPEISIEDVAKIAEKLWDSKWHEEKTLSVMLLQHKSKELTLEQMPLLEKMINEASGWDHLDEIAIHLVGSLIDNNPKVIKYLTKWSKSKNFWVRRASLLSQIPQFRRKKGDKQLFSRLAIPMFNKEKNWSKEERFFIRKAIGWVLREIAQKEPEIAYSFIKRYKTKMSGLTYKEGTRKLPNVMQKELNKI